MVLFGLAFLRCLVRAGSSAVFQRIWLPTAKTMFNGHLQWHNLCFRPFLASRRCLICFSLPVIEREIGGRQPRGEGLATQKKGCGARSSGRTGQC